MEHTFVVEQKSFLAILSSMQPICTRRTTISTTSYILLHVSHRELVLKCTDLEISLQCSYLLQDSNIDDSRSLLVSGRRIFELVKELEGDITFTLAEERLFLLSGSVNLSLNIKDAAEFPVFPERIENFMQISSSFLLDMFNKVAFLIPQNNSNPALNGLLLEISNKEIKMTTTDGHCLAQICSSNYTLEETRTWLIPRRAIFEIKKILENAKELTTFVGTCGNQMVFSGESFNFFTKLLVDKFPEYNSILERKGFRPAVLDKSSFSKTLRRSACLLAGQFIPTQFSFDKNVLRVSMDNKEVGTLKESISLKKFEGEKMYIHFYAPYLLNGLQIFSQNDLTFYLHSSIKPLIFESKGKEIHLIYLVMPVSPTAS